MSLGGELFAAGRRTSVVFCPLPELLDFIASRLMPDLLERLTADSAAKPTGNFTASTPE
jgi:hypothetical protein